MVLLPPYTFSFYRDLEQIRSSDINIVKELGVSREGEAGQETEKHSGCLTDTQMSMTEQQNSQHPSDQLL